MNNTLNLSAAYELEQSLFKKSSGKKSAPVCVSQAEEGQKNNYPYKDLDLVIQY